MAGVFTYKSKPYPHLLSYVSNNDNHWIEMVLIPRTEVTVPDYIQWKAKGLIMEEYLEMLAIKVGEPPMSLDPYNFI